MGGYKMKRKILSLIIIGLFLSLTSSIPQPLLAGDEENPEIEDEIEEGIAGYLDIISAWFYESSDQPEYLYICLKIKDIDIVPLKQHLTIHWDYNDIPCAAMMAVGYDEDEIVQYVAGWGHGFWFQEHYQEVEGEYDETTGVITLKIPKSCIKDPQKGDTLANTYALTFQRYGFIGMLGFDRFVLQSFINFMTGKQHSDVGPNDGYGRDYIIQY